MNRLKSRVSVALALASLASSALAADYTYRSPVTNLSYTDPSVTPFLIVNPPSVIFPDVIAGEFADIPVTISNGSSTTSLTSVRAILTGNSFSLLNNTCGTTGATIAIPANGSCSATIRFSPSDPNLFIGALTADSLNGSPNLESISIMGSGILAPVSEVSVLDGASILFNQTTVGYPGKPYIKTIVNTGNSPLVLGTLILGGSDSSEFALVSSTCNGVTLPVGDVDGCQVSTRFVPTTPGVKSALISIPDNTGTGPHSISLSGEAIPGEAIMAITGNPEAAHVFSNTIVATAATDFVVSLTNEGTASGSVPTPMILGPHASDFSVSSNSCNNIAPTASCSIAIRFVPSSTGAKSAEATIIGEVFSLAGTGIQAVLSKSLESNFNVAVGSSSPIKTVTTITNTGSAPSMLTVGAAPATYSFAGQQAGDCYSGLTLNINDSCVIRMVSSPTVEGTTSASLPISGSGGAAPIVVTLSTSTAAVDPYYNNVSLLLHLDQNTPWVDQKGHTITTTGTPRLASSANSKFGTGALNLPAGEGALRSTSADYAFGTGNFTVEAWIYPTSLSGYHSIAATRSTGSSSSSAWLFAAISGGQLIIYSDTQYIETPAGSLPVNTWSHVAAVRNSGTTRLYINGVQRASASDGRNFTASTVGIGADATGNGERLIGRIDEVRITKGVAVYTSNFTAPAVAFPNQ